MDLKGGRRSRRMGRLS